MLKIPNGKAGARLLNVVRLQETLRREQVDALVATAPENVTYSSGYWALSQWIRRGPQCYVVLPAEDVAASCLIAPTSLLDQVADQDIWIANVRRYGHFQIDRSESLIEPLDRYQAELLNLPDDGSAITALCNAIGEAGLEKSRIAIDELGLLPGHWEELLSRLPHATLVPGAAVFRKIRAVKTEDEVRRLRQAAQIAERSIEAAMAVAREGISELELARAFHRRTVEEDGWPVLGVIGFGPRSAMTNVHPSETRLRPGDVIRFDVGGRYQHYRADIARIGVLGEPSKRVKTYYDALHRGVQRGLEMIRPGVRAADVFSEMVETVRREGIAHYKRSHVGHGIGLDGYDLPDLAPHSDLLIEEGMTLCVETPYYELGWCGLQVEDMVVVRSTGIETLMSTDGRLLVA